MRVARVTNNEHLKNDSNANAFITELDSQSYSQRDNNRFETLHRRCHNLPRASSMPPVYRNRAKIDRFFIFFNFSYILYKHDYLPSRDHVRRRSGMVYSGNAVGRRCHMFISKMIIITPR